MGVLKINIFHNLREKLDFSTKSEIFYIFSTKIDILYLKFQSGMLDIFFSVNIFENSHGWVFYVYIF